MIEINMDDLLIALKESFTSIMRNIDLDKSDLVNKSRFTVEGNSIVVQMFEYGIWIDSGRRKYAVHVPIKDLVSWISEKAINIPSGMTAEQFAYAISNSIYNKGIEARPFIDRLNEEVNKLTLIYINTKIVEQLKRDIDNQ